MEIMEEIKSKSVIIKGDLHLKLKNYCKGRSLKIGGVIQDLITAFLKYPREIQELIDRSKVK